MPCRCICLPCSVTADHAPNEASEPSGQAESAITTMSRSLQAARRGSGTAGAEAHSELQRIEVGSDEAEMDMMPNYTNIHTKVLYNMK